MKVIEAYEAIQPGTTVVLHAPKTRFATVHSRASDGTLLVRALVASTHTGYAKMFAILPKDYAYTLREEEGFTRWWMSQYLSSEARHLASMA